MLAGVTIVDPASTWIEVDVEIEPDVTIHPQTVVRGPATIATGAEIGPFAYIRPETRVGRRRQDRDVRRGQEDDRRGP